VRVLTFSLGFGPKLINVKRGDTEYCVSLVPLGGYVKMAGENPEDSRTGAPDEFLSKGKWQRFQVLVMGPIMKPGAGRRGDVGRPLPGAHRSRRSNSSRSVIGTFSEDVGRGQGRIESRRPHRQPSTARPSTPGDQFATAIVPKAKREVSIGFIRDGKHGQVIVVPEGQGKYELGDIGVQPPVRPEILEFSPGSPAAAAGLQKFDVVPRRRQRAETCRASGWSR